MLVPKGGNSRDPIGEDGGINLYGYVGNDPINAIDLLGLQMAEANGYIPNIVTGWPIRAYSAPSFFDNVNPSISLTLPGVRNFDQQTSISRRFPNVVEAAKNYFRVQMDIGKMPSQIKPFRFVPGDEIADGDLPMSRYERIFSLGKFTFVLSPDGKSMTLNDVLGTQREDFKGDGMLNDASFQILGRMCPTQKATRGTWPLDK